jgi:DNA repair exonuclease SbcCD nuclease subunit
LITDTHWGFRNDASIFIEHNKKFLDDVFFPFLEDNKIDTIIHLGDLVDRRKYININTAHRLRVDFLDKIVERNINFHIIAGNHDTYYKNTNQVNSLREFVVDKYPNFNVIDMEATEVTFDGLSILMLPWICDENRSQVMSKINDSKAQIVMGHLELKGFEMSRGNPSDHGDDRSIFNKFDMVFSGHFHHRSTDGTIFYLGSHCEFTWADYDDPRGFHVFDTETRQINFIQNPYAIFAKIWYNDEDRTADEIVHSFDYERYNNSIVKVIVQSKTNPYWFDMFIEKLEKAGVEEFQIVEDHLNLNVADEEIIVNEAEDTLTIFNTYIKQVPASGVNKDQLNNVITQLYNEALTIT